jgi:glycosyltransferase involved in cell wall biosynthesis
MKILMYIDSMAPAGGIERVVSKHATFFLKYHEVILITKDDKESFYVLPSLIATNSLHIDNSMNMHNKFERIFQSARQLLLAKKKLGKIINGYDLFYVTHVRNLLELYLAGVDMQKVIVTEHGSYYAYNKIYKKLKKFLYPKCKYIVSPTSMDFEIYKNEDCNSIYIPNPLSFFNEKYSFLNQKIVVNIGRLTGDKRQELLLYIWKKITLIHSDWRLKIIGHGELENDLKIAIKRLQLENSVEIVKPMKNIETAYLNSSVFVLTSKYEGFGMVLAEAMAYGVPCVSFDIPSGPRDIINHSDDGFLIEDGNIEEYVEKLNTLISDKDKRIKMGKRAKQNISKFLDKKIEKKWIKLLKDYQK